MKKISTARAKKVEKVESQKLTIGLDLGDRYHQVHLRVRTPMLHRRQQLRIDPHQPGQRSGIQPVIFLPTFPDQTHVAGMRYDIQLVLRSE